MAFACLDATEGDAASRGRARGPHGGRAVRPQGGSRAVKAARSTSPPRAPTGCARSSASSSPRPRRRGFRPGGVYVSALSPVSARPMISFWICDVPS
jgi:hypothetical protein